MKEQLLAGILLACATLAPVGAQATSETVPAPPVLSIDDLVIAHYRPLRVDPDELLGVSQRMLGRAFYVRERGGKAGGPVANLQLLGDSLLVYDEKGSVERMLALLRSLDSDEAEGLPEGASPVVVQEFRPRFARIGTILDVLKPTRHEVMVRGAAVQSVSFVKERNLVILRDEPAAVADLLELLQRIDVPQPEIQLQCILLMPGKEQGPGPVLPEELRRELKTLVPRYDFQSVGFALLRTGVNPGTRIRALLGDVDDQSYELSFRPTAFDAESGSLSVEYCSLVRSLTGTTDPPRQSIFSTSMMMRGDEYTVLGASGAEPVFVVVRVERSS